MPRMFVGESGDVGRGGGGGTGEDDGALAHGLGRRARAISAEGGRARREASVTMIMIDRFTHISRGRDENVEMVHLEFHSSSSHVILSFITRDTSVLRRWIAFDISTSSVRAFLPRGTREPHASGLGHSRARGRARVDIRDSRDVPRPSFSSNVPVRVRRSPLHHSGNNDFALFPPIAECRCFRPPPP